MRIRTDGRRDVGRYIPVMWLFAGFLWVLGGGLAGCAAQRTMPGSGLLTEGMLDGYRAAQTAELSASAAAMVGMDGACVRANVGTWGRGDVGTRTGKRLAAGNPSAADVAADVPTAGRLRGAGHGGPALMVGAGGRWDGAPVALGMFAADEPQEPASQPAATRPALPEDYWRQDVWHQMDHEFKSLLKRDFWRGFKTSFWDLENVLWLTATMGASISIRETGVDDAIRRRTAGRSQLGDFDEPLQLLSHPGTHFAATGVLWLTSTLTRDAKQHEVAKTLTQALAVNGTTTLLLKAAANTRGPDNERHAWPSGHTSSIFTVAAVLNEYYGPWVGVPSLALAGLAGYQRIDSRVHDFSDVVFGAMLGYVVGTSIARDNKAEFPELFGMKVVPFVDPQTGSSGLALMKQW